jgi:hypothetical protein
MLLTARPFIFKVVLLTISVLSRRRRALETFGHHDGGHRRYNLEDL